MLYGAPLWALLGGTLQASLEEYLEMEVGAPCMGAPKWVSPIAFLGARGWALLVAHVAPLLRVHLLATWESVMHKME